MPEAREKAEEASFATLVEGGRAVLRRRRMQAWGGSNSMWVVDAVLVLALALAVVSAFVAELGTLSFVVFGVELLFSARASAATGATVVAVASVILYVILEGGIKIFVCA